MVGEDQESEYEQGQRDLLEALLKETKTTVTHLDILMAAYDSIRIPKEVVDDAREKQPSVDHPDRVQFSELVHVPDPEGWDGEAFACRDCGKEIKHPFGGHTWTCHEDYGGCGAQFKPIKALRRVNDE